MQLALPLVTTLVSIALILALIGYVRRPDPNEQQTYARIRRAVSVIFLYG
jgi:hypothetical protein